MNFAFLLFYSLSVFSNIEEPPTGTIKIKNHYIDYTEILNIHWQEFLYYKRQTMDSIQIKTLLPDSSNTWYELPAYRYHPIVLITYEQALAYCKWRSKAVSELKNRKIIYRLPTIKEWKEIASEVLTKEYKINQKDVNKVIKSLKVNPDAHFFDRSGVPRNRVYDLFDNVSEMTQQKGLAMGANNFMLTSLEENLIKSFKYDSSSYLIGFRCIAEYQD